MLAVLSSMYPEAPIYTLAYDKEVFPEFAGRDVRVSPYLKTGLARKLLRFFLPLMPAATEAYDLSDFEVVISSSSAFAKGVITRPGTLHFCYCHTPTRYLWSDTHSYTESLRIPRIIKTILWPILSYLRVWDYLAAQRVDDFIANSNTVKERILKYYRKDSRIIYPPVEVDRFVISDEPKKFYLTGGRLVDYKRFDLVVDACTKANRPLVIFGDGPALEDLKSRAGKNVTFMGRVSDEERSRLFSEAIAFIHPHEEDFGITAVESMAAGRPVIAYRKGGALETVIEGETGEFFDNQSVEELMNTIVNFEERRFNPVKIKEFSNRFSSQKFRESFGELVKSEWMDYSLKKLGRR